MADNAKATPAEKRNLYAEVKEGVEIEETDAHALTVVLKSGHTEAELKVYLLNNDITPIYYEASVRQDKTIVVDLGVPKEHAATVLQADILEKSKRHFVAFVLQPTKGPRLIKAHHLFASLRTTFKTSHLRVRSICNLWTNDKLIPTGKYLVNIGFEGGAEAPIETVHHVRVKKEGFTVTYGFKLQVIHRCKKCWGDNHSTENCIYMSQQEKIRFPEPSHDGAPEEMTTGTENIEQAENDHNNSTVKKRRTEKEKQK